MITKSKSQEIYPKHPLERPVIPPETRFLCMGMYGIRDKIRPLKRIRENPLYCYKTGTSGF